MHQSWRVLDPLSFIIFTSLPLYPAVLDVVDASTARIAYPLHAYHSCWLLPTRLELSRRTARARMDSGVMRTNFLKY